MTQPKAEIVQTIGPPYHHEDERECFRMADGSGWHPWVREDGIAGRANDRCERVHPCTCGSGDERFRDTHATLCPKFYDLTFPSGMIDPVTAGLDDLQDQP